MSALDKFRALYWGAMAFMAFGVVFFATCVGWLLTLWSRARARRREERMRWAMDPTRHGPLTLGAAVRRLRR